MFPKMNGKFGKVRKIMPKVERKRNDGFLFSVAVSNIFDVHPEISNLTSIFFRWVETTNQFSFDFFVFTSKEQ